VVRERIDLTQVCQRYKARVIHVAPQEDYYLLETNRGPKELRVWPRVDILRWSYAWREQLVKDGFRDVERFIRTRDAKPYVVLGRKGYTLTDHVRGAETALTAEEAAAHCGQLTAAMHRAQQQHQVGFASELFGKEQAHARHEADRAKRYYLELADQSSLHEQAKWVISLFPPLLQRMERSAQLLAAARIEPDQLAVSHRELGMENWLVHQGRIVLRGFYRPNLSVQLRDVAGFLRDLYREHGDLRRIDLFLDGYEEVRPLSYEEYKVLLAFMAFPQELWLAIDAYVGGLAAGQADTGTDGITAALSDQKRIDHLLQHVAYRAERLRGGVVHEPI